MRIDVNRELCLIEHNYLEEDQNEVVSGDYNDKMQDMKLLSMERGEIEELSKFLGLDLIEEDNSLEVVSRILDALDEDLPEERDQFIATKGAC